MRNKELLQKKVDKVEGLVKGIGYNIRVAEYEEGFRQIEVVLEVLEEVRTLLNTETQD